MWMVIYRHYYSDYTVIYVTSTMKTPKQDLKLDHERFHMHILKLLTPMH